MNKPSIQYFVSYARANNVNKAKMVDSLNAHLALSKDFKFQRWQDSDIFMGDDWLEDIAEAVAVVDVGLMLLSPAFFASKTIREDELPGLLTKNLGVLPVLLEPLDFGTMDLGVFNKLQVFTLQGKAFSQMRGKAEQNKFVMELFKAITRKLQARVPVVVN